MNVQFQDDFPTSFQKYLWNSLERSNSEYFQDNKNNAPLARSSVPNEMTKILSG
jgi:hypothetical protein